MLHETSAREALAEMRQGRSTDEYIALVWASRYPHPMPRRFRRLAVRA
jgi:hypothetical protein